MRDPVGEPPRMFGTTLEAVRLPWAWAVDRMSRSPIYWITAVLPTGRPHARPVWAVFLDDRIRFSTGSLAAAIFERETDVSVQIQMASDTTNDIVIVEGTTTTVSDRGLVERICTDYNRKYNYDLSPDSLPGPFRTVEPRKVFAWKSDDSGLDGGSAFHGSVTRWRF